MVRKCNKVKSTANNSRSQVGHDCWALVSDLLKNPRGRRSTRDFLLAARPRVSSFVLRPSSSGKIKNSFFQVRQYQWTNDSSRTVLVRRTAALSRPWWPKLERQGCDSKSSVRRIGPAGILEKVRHRRHSYMRRAKCATN